MWMHFLQTRSKTFRGMVLSKSHEIRDIRESQQRQTREKVTNATDAASEIRPGLFGGGLHQA